MENLKYPIGKFEYGKTYSSSDTETHIEVIATLFNKLKNLSDSLGDENLKKPYRPDGWTGKQVIHHLADSHINSYIRYKWALTEDNPTIKPYFEDKWAALPDSEIANIALSLNLLDNLHQRWVILLKTMTNSDFDRTFYHPKSERAISLREATAMYAWHSEHHYQHLLLLK
jgi:hypothetical protein